MKQTREKKLTAANLILRFRLKFGVLVILLGLFFKSFGEGKSACLQSETKSQAKAQTQSQNTEKYDSVSMTKKQNLGFPYDRSWKNYQAPKNPNEPLTTFLMTNLSETIVRLGGSFTNRQDLEHAKTLTSKSPSELDWRIHAGGLTDAPRGEGPKIAEFSRLLSTQYERFAVQDLKNKYQFDRYTVISMEIGASNVQPPKEVQSTRYGLILKDIGGAPKEQHFAALTEWEEAVQGAPKAQVSWGVGPIELDPLAPYPFQIESKSVQTEGTSENWDFSRTLPKPRAKLLLRPETVERVSILGAKDGAPKWRMDLEQVDGLYQYTQFYGSKDPTSEHRLSLPLLSKTYWISRVYAENMIAKESHVRTRLNQGIKADLAARFNHLEDRWVFDLVRDFNGAQWGVVAKAKANSPNIDPKDASENYQVSLGFDL